MALNILKSDLTDKVVYTLPIQGDLLNPCTVTVYKTDDGSLNVTMDMDQSYGLLSWTDFCSSLEQGADIEVI